MSQPEAQPLLPDQNAAGSGEQLGDTSQGLTRVFSRRLSKSEPTRKLSKSEKEHLMQERARQEKMHAKMDELTEDFEMHGYKDSWFWKHKLTVAAWYQKDSVQFMVAALILSNFIVQVIQRQVDPVVGGEPLPGKNHGEIWRMISDFFNVVFLIELLVNLYGTWRFPGWLVGWNNFDCVVVTLGVVDLCHFDYPGQLKLLRMLRVFRIFRLFARVESLQRILYSLTAALPGVMNAGVIMMILMCIFAVIAVDLVGYVFSAEDLQCNDDGVCLAKCSEELEIGVTPRGHCWGFEYYGTFWRAWYTLFQIMTGESWSEAAVRPMMFYFKEDFGAKGQLVIFLFVFLYVILSSWVMLNVIVTVLLDKFSESDTQGDDDSKEQRVAFDQMRDSVGLSLANLQQSIDSLVVELDRKHR